MLGGEAKQIVNNQKPSLRAPVERTYKEVSTEYELNIPKDNTPTPGATKVFDSFIRVNSHL